MQGTKLSVDDELGKLRTVVHLMESRKVLEGPLRSTFELEARQLQAYCVDNAIEHFPRVDLYLAEFRIRLEAVRTAENKRR